MYRTKDKIQVRSNPSLVLPHKLIVYAQEETVFYSSFLTIILHINQITNRMSISSQDNICVPSLKTNILKLSS